MPSIWRFLLICAACALLCGCTSGVKPQGSPSPTPETTLTPPTLKAQWVQMDAASQEYTLHASFGDTLVLDGWDALYTLDKAQEFEKLAEIAQLKALFGQQELAHLQQDFQSEFSAYAAAHPGQEYEMQVDSALDYHVSAQNNIYTLHMLRLYALPEDGQRALLGECAFLSSYDPVTRSVGFMQQVVRNALQQDSSALLFFAAIAAVDGEGNVYLEDNRLHEVHVYDNTGTLRYTMPYQGSAALVPGWQKFMLVGLDGMEQSAIYYADKGEEQPFNMQLPQEYQGARLKAVGSVLQGYYITVALDTEEGGTTTQLYDVRSNAFVDLGEIAYGEMRLEASDLQALAGQLLGTLGEMSDGYLTLDILAWGQDGFALLVNESTVFWLTL